MNSFKVAMLQLLPTGSLQGNLEKGESYCRRAKDMGADLALFPEMWSTGYAMPLCPEAAVAAESGFVQHFAGLAKELEMAIGITFLEKRGENMRNTLCVFDRFGRNVLTYAKVHTCDFEDERNLLPGDDFYTADLNTAGGDVTIGAMICYDREFPESARILMLKGAEIILVPNACPMEINRIAQLRGRAYENMVGIATCNYAEGQPDCNGHSNAFDGMAYLPDVRGSRDTEILEAGGEEGVYVADFPMEQLRWYRANEVHGNAFRRPEKYGLLLSKEVKEPFIRKRR